MNIKEKIDSYYRQYGAILFYGPIAFSFLVIYGQGKLPGFDFEVPIYISLISLGLGIYSFYLLSEDYTALNKSYDQLESTLKVKVSSNIIKSNIVSGRDDFEEALHQPKKRDDFESVLEGLK
jgi:hypothetical protein